VLVVAADADPEAAALLATLDQQRAQGAHAFVTRLHTIGGLRPSLDPDRASAIADRFGERADELMEIKDDWLEAARGYVKDHPVASLGIAVAAGYLLSAIMRGGKD